ncbi:uncharacterized protein P174DRAFT_502107 [Aspergillus novofumigatus IBT 16806]|uniref:Mitochondrial ATPase expression-domain-containing protein n=1 Tax=Aspergillus novofumigatus (strain IBT 16806) TaxID=1392255 RepID=A0A2I1CIU4_ASPN1|nr:uncharacterized protein P174DRAFT_502107 [Aspergillus novofumigatus IBT 16806]PKX97551.1 hypothetical protein P174DRAFT_502107 [Aspergillus novofumigatus IBT 16806]
MFRSIIGRYGHCYGSSRLTGSAPRPTLCQTRSLANHPASFVDAKYPAHLEQHHLDHHQNDQRPPGYHRELAPLLSRFHAIGSMQSTVVSPGDHGDAQKEVPEGLEDEFFSILRDGQPDLVMNALLDPKFEVVVGSLPESTFVEAFRLLSPAYFTDPFRAIYRALHPSAVAVKGYPQLDRIFDKFACNLATIVSIRRSAGHRLGLAEYTHLLDCARSTGDALMADHVWHAMRQDKVIPDVHCYNHYMEAKVWDGAYTGREKYHLRVTPFAYRKRRFDEPNVGWKGYGTARRSVRKEIMRILTQMTEEGTSGDEGTYVNVILASSRVGYTATMKHVLKTVWNVDIDALAALEDSSSLPRPKKYHRSSPLYPSSRLLFAVAHAFGTNNDIPGAMRAVSFISLSYDIPVPEEVWQELLERSFVLSRPRFGKDARRNRKGKVPYEFLTALGQTMKSEPFDVQPTMEMYQLLAKTAWDQAKLPDFKQYMESAYAILEETRRKRRTARAIIENYLGPPQSEATASDFDPKLLQSRAFTVAVHTYDVLRMRTAQQTTIMERLAKLLLIHPRWVGRDNPVWERQLLPRVIEEWQDFLPESVLFQIRSGDVFVHGETYWGDRLLNTHRRIPVRRPTVDNGLVLDEDARELDDDFFWACYPADLRYMNIPAVERLFSGVPRRLANPVRRRAASEEAMAADAVDERAGAMPHAVEAEHPSQRPLGGSVGDEDIFDPTTNPLAVA